MHKVICFKNNGHPQTLHCGVLVPGQAAEVEVSDFQLQCLRDDCRVTVLSGDEFETLKKEKAAEKKSFEKGRKEKAERIKAEKKAKADVKAAAEKKQGELDAARKG